MLEIIFLYSEDICPFKSSFWSDIWQIGPDIIYWLTTLWRRELKMCWWHVRSSCPIIMWNWPDIFKIWSDNVRWPTVISSTDYCYCKQIKLNANLVLKNSKLSQSVVRFLLLLCTVIAFCKIHFYFVGLAGWNSKTGKLGFLRYSLSTCINIGKSQWVVVIFLKTKNV